MKVVRKSSSYLLCDQTAVKTKGAAACSTHAFDLGDGKGSLDLAAQSESIDLWCVAVAGNVEQCEPVAHLQHMVLAARAYRLEKAGQRSEAIAMLREARRASAAVDPQSGDRYARGLRAMEEELFDSNQQLVDQLVEAGDLPQAIRLLKELESVSRRLKTGSLQQIHLRRVELDFAWADRQKHAPAVPNETSLEIVRLADQSQKRTEGKEADPRSKTQTKGRPPRANSWTIPKAAVALYDLRTPKQFQEWCEERKGKFYGNLQGDDPEATNTQCLDPGLGTGVVSNYSMEVGMVFDEQKRPTYAYAGTIFRLGNGKDMSPKAAFSELVWRLGRSHIESTDDQIERRDWVVNEGIAAALSYGYTEFHKFSWLVIYALNQSAEAVRRAFKMGDDVKLPDEKLWGILETALGVLETPKSELHNVCNGLGGKFFQFLGGDYECRSGLSPVGARYLGERPVRVTVVMKSRRRQAEALDYMTERFGKGTEVTGFLGFQGLRSGDIPYREWLVGDLPGDEDVLVRMAVKAARLDIHVPFHSKTDVRAALGMSEKTPRKLPTKQTRPAKKDKALIAQEAEILKKRPYCSRYTNVLECPKFHRDDRGDCRYENGVLNVISPQNAMRTRSLAGEPAWCSRPCLQSDPYNAARAQAYCCAPIDEPPSSQCPKFSSR
jgi:hypothetical protein